jgi:phosphoglycerate-specific signal transduction histidine kinase
MLPKHIIEEIHKIEGHIKAKKERIEKLKRLSKLNKNVDLISEYDAIIKQCDDTINATIERKDFIESSREQVIVHGCASVRLMAKGLKSSLCEADKQIEMLNNSIEDDNIKIQGIKDNSKSTGGNII